ncbi:Lipocalin-like domain-containing protein [Xaviernesmea oryzae]|uniref:Lipocalin-like domain-containing protein n=2 Tax=Xaviernesmea oryzae TaxID=464029 RepID=A0A1X7FT58_9HYPH|nr:lipocalin-like domain-containing protein [Xaviernesmea oryzae]SMF58367.1 Lipocalin-like domain-containing protein [Xaviernesmea oryzae]
MHIHSALLGLLIAFSPVAVSAQTASANKVAGTWRMISAQIDPEGRNLPAYGQRPNGLLVFTPDMHFVEVLTDADTPRFASSVRGEGTDAENRQAMARSIGFFGTYTVDENGEFSGNRVEGATFPNWIGGTRTRDELTLTVVGDRMTEHFQRPEGTRIMIEWERVK